MGIMTVFDLSGDEKDSMKDSVEANSGNNVINPASGTTVGTTGEVGDVSSKEEKPEEKMVVLDGPLSQIYTQALNLAYAKEGLSTMVSFLEAGHKSLTGKDDLEEDRLLNGNAVTEDGTYVYCIDTTDLDGEGIVVATEALKEAKKRYKNIVLALESGTVINARTELMAQLGADLHVHVNLTRSGAINGVLDVLKR